MIEAGLTQLVQADSAVHAICPVGGFLAQLPKDYTLPTWSYLMASDMPTYSFEGPNSLRSRRIQIDCYGSDGKQVIQLADAIDAVLNGYRGTLPDGDSIVVPGCFRSNLIDFPLDQNRSYRRMLEYVIWFYQ